MQIGRQNKEFNEVDSVIMSTKYTKIDIKLPACYIWHTCQNVCVCVRAHENNKPPTFKHAYIVLSCGCEYVSVE